MSASCYASVFAALKVPDVLRNDGAEVFTLAPLL